MTGAAAVAVSGPAQLRVAIDPIEKLIADIRSDVAGFESSASETSLRELLGKKDSATAKGIIRVLEAFNSTTANDYPAVVCELSRLEGPAGGRFANVLVCLRNILREGPQDATLQDLATVATALTSVAEASRGRELYTNLTELQRRCLNSKEFCDAPVVKKICAMVLEHAPVLRTRTNEMFERITRVVRAGGCGGGSDAPARTMEILSNLDQIDQAIRKFGKESHRVVELMFNEDLVYGSDLQERTEARTTQFDQVVKLSDLGLSAKLVAKCFLALPSIRSVDPVGASSGLVVVLVDRADFLKKPENLRYVQKFLSLIGEHDLKFSSVTEAVRHFVLNATVLGTPDKIQNYFMFLSRCLLTASRYENGDLGSLVNNAFQLIKYRADRALPHDFMDYGGNKEEGNRRYRAGWGWANHHFLPATFCELLKFLANRVHSEASEGHSVLKIKDVLHKLVVRKRVDVLGPVALGATVISGVLLGASMTSGSPLAGWQAPIAAVGILSAAVEYACRYLRSNWLRSMR